MLEQTNTFSNFFTKQLHIERKNKDREHVRMTHVPDLYLLF